MKKLVFLLALLLLLWGALSIYAQTTTVELVSVSSTGVQGNGQSEQPSISADGRFVAFHSFANNLVPNDARMTMDVFVYDRDTDTIELASVSSLGEQANGNSSYPWISADGRYVTFMSDASNLVAFDTNSVRDIFVYDRETDTIERVSIGAAQGSGHSEYPAISADGRFVVFRSFAGNLVPNDTNGTADTFVYDRDTDTIEIVSISNQGVQGNGQSVTATISADGRYVAFDSPASNLVPDDTNSSRDAFVYDRDTNTIERISLSSSGEQGNNLSYFPGISADGRFVSFWSDASNLVPNDTNNTGDIFVYDRNTDTVERVSVSDAGVQANGISYSRTISPDGRFVPFYSEASNLVPDDTNGFCDHFIYDLHANTIERVSISGTGEQGNAACGFAVVISADGRFAAFASRASNLVADDTNGVDDIFVYDRGVQFSYDVNEDDIVSPTDAIYVINRLGSGDLSADVDGSGVIDSVDVDYILAVLEQ